MIWWWELGYKDRQTPDSVIKFGCEVNVRSIHEEEDSIAYIYSLITWCNLNCDDIFSITLPLLVVMSFLHNYLFSGLILENCQEILLRKNYFALQTQDLAQTFLLKIPIDLAIDLKTYTMQWRYKITYH